MTDRDLGALLERASDGVPELDFADQAWAAAVAQRQHRRRVWAGSVAAVVAAGLAVTAVQLGGSPTPTPAPAMTSGTTPATRTGTLSDGTPYATMPAEGEEAQLPDFDAGLPSVMELGKRTAKLSFTPTPATPVVAVYLTEEGESYKPVVVTATGERFLVDQLRLRPKSDIGGNLGAPLGTRAVDKGGRFVVFPQPGEVVRLDLHTGETVRYPVPSQYLEWAGWSSTGAIVARDAEHAWAIDPAKAGAEAVPVDEGYEGRFRITATEPTSSGGYVTTYDERAVPGETIPLRAPLFQTWAETLSTQQWAATGAFFDQDVTSDVIRRGSGPIYQGLVAWDTEQRRARVLLAPENPDGQTGRFKGCCTVLGWADGKTVLFRSVGSHGQWILAWNVATGEVFEVSRLDAGRDATIIPALALNVGQRD